MTNKKFIIGVREHNYLGLVLNAYWVTPERNKDFYTKIEALSLEKEDEVTLVESKILRLINQNSDHELLRVFSKKKKISTQDFFTSMKQEFFKERIRPYIELRFKKILDLLIENELPLFFKLGANIHFDDEIRVKTVAAKAIFNFTKKNDHTEYFLSILQESKETNLFNKPFYILVNEPAYVIINSELFHFEDIDSKKLLPFFLKKYVSIEKRLEQTYYEKFILHSLNKYEVKALGFVIKEMKLQPKLKIQLQTGLDGKLSFLAFFFYGKESIAVHLSVKPKVWFEKKEDRFTFFRLHRAVEVENVLLSKLANIGIVQENEQVFKIKDIHIENIDDYNFDTVNWLNQHKINLEKEDIELIESQKSNKYYTDFISLNVENKRRKDWFDLKVVVELDGFKIPFSRFKRNIENEDREFKLPNGKIIILPKEWFKKFHFLVEEGEDIMGWIHVDKKKALFLSEMEEIEQDSDEYLGHLVAIYNKKIEPLPVPSNLNAQLRSYQQMGFSWLAELSNENLGACLADDMGLGKTIQAISFIQYLKEVSKQPKSDTNKSEYELFEHEKRKFAALVVVPTSLVYNWQSEIEKFTPENKVALYIGLARHDIQFLDFDIIITTYGVIRNDIETLSKKIFSLIILDESQYIKNPNSKIYRAISELIGKHKIVLTGTPIENSLSDLWAQMDFINPGLLGNYSYFKKNYLQEIEKYQNEEVRDRFKKLVNPFILRRTKQEVAKDLPQLSVQTRYCLLSEKHQKLYEEEKSKVRNIIIENGENPGFWRKNRMLVLQSIGRLRQLANQISLVEPQNTEISEKFLEILRVSREIIQENHKVLLFSSYVKILKIFQAEFEKENLSYALLTGEMSKKQREKNIADFQSDKNIKLFLLSIKAGGVGLNLTAADYVIIIDPWWNPAVENQAINRAHRIGQNKNVMVYRFISKNTIEEKIKKLQNKKQALSDEILDFEKDMNLEMEEIKALFN